MSALSDAEVIGRSLGEPEAFGLIYDRHAATVLRFLGRRAGARVAEGLVGELFRIAFERRKTFDASRATALPWLYGIGSNLLLKHRRAEARRLRASARMAAAESTDRRASEAALDARLLFPRVADAIEGLPDDEREALLLFAWEELSYQSMAEALELPIGTVRSRLNRARASARTARAEGEREGEIAMKPVDLARKLRRDAAFEPAVLGRGKETLMAAIRQEVEPRRRPTVIPQLPYADIRAALTFLERAFGFREIPATRMEGADGMVHHALVEFGDSVIGIGTQGAHGAVSPQRGGIESQYLSVAVADVEAHYQRARAAGARTAREPRGHGAEAHAYEAFDPEGHRWRFVHQRLREVTQERTSG